MESDVVLRQVRKWGMALPSIGKLVVALMLDPRVPKANKLIVGAITAYLVDPIGIVPRRLLGLRRINDVVLPVVALDVLLNGASDEVLRDHWDGDPEVLLTLRRVARRGSALAPARVQRLIGSAG
jgi:uncharacterized membrane protein YkvA (DUF1232 family)